MTVQSLGSNQLEIQVFHEQLKMAHALTRKNLQLPQKQVCEKENNSTLLQATRVSCVATKGMAQISTTYSKPVIIKEETNRRAPNAKAENYILNDVSYSNVSRGHKDVPTLCRQNSMSVISTMSDRQTDRGENASSVRSDQGSPRSSFSVKASSAEVAVKISACTQMQTQVTAKTIPQSDSRVCSGCCLIM